MSVVEQKQELQKRNPASDFRLCAQSLAKTILSEWVGEERAREATGRIAAAMAASAAASKDPAEFYRCQPASIATCIAVSALTGIMPSTGSAALAYVYPQAARKGEQPLLQYTLSHRGCNALARRCGQFMMPIAIGTADKIVVGPTGEVSIEERDIDNPPSSLSELRGVVLIVKQLETGLVIASGWVPIKTILARRAISRSASSDYSPWAKWPVEMALKTAMHYAIGRGWCVIDDTEAVRALQVDAESDFDPVIVDVPAIEHDATTTKTQKLEEKITAMNPVEPVVSTGLTDEEKAVIRKAEATQS
jgi:recombinational DNA repair protein RecT